MKTKGDSMKKTGITLMIAVAVTVSGCMSDVEVTSSTEQDLCTIEDQQAGTCTLRILTRDTARSQVPPGETIVSETYGVCIGHYCAVRIELPQLVMVTVCIDHQDGNGPTCSTVSCNPGVNCPAT